MSLRGRIVAGLTWTGGVHWVGVVVSTATVALLARLLSVPGGEPGLEEWRRLAEAGRAPQLPAP